MDSVQLQRSISTAFRKHYPAHLMVHKDYDLRIDQGAKMIADGVIDASENPPARTTTYAKHRKIYSDATKKLKRAAKALEEASDALGSLEEISRSRVMVNSSGAFWPKGRFPITPMALMEKKTGNWPDLKHFLGRQSIADLDVRLMKSAALCRDFALRIEPNEIGGKERSVEVTVASCLAFLVELVTGQRPAIATCHETGSAYGPFLNLVEEVLSISGFSAEGEHMARKALGYRK